MNRKTLIWVGGGAALILLYILWRRQQAGAAAQPTDTAGTTSSQEASDFATLAGMLQQQQAQEQGDVSTVQGGLANNLAGEQADVATLQGAQAAANAVEQGDIANVTAAETTWQASLVKGKFGGLFPVANANIAALQKAVANVNKELAHIAAGQKKPPKKPHQPHGKTGQRNRPAPNPHANGNHPAGTGGKAVGQRSHAPKKKQPARR